MIPWRVVPVCAMLMLIVPAPARGETTSCYPFTGEYNTGSTTFTVKTRTSEIAAWGQEDGWIKFDISAVPDDEVIYALHLHFYVRETDGSPRWGTTRVTVDPVTAPADLLSWDINAEPFSEAYSYRGENNYVPGWKTVELNTRARYDLGACLDQDWFVIGIRRDHDYLVMDGWAEANQPYLEVIHFPARTLYVDDDAPGDPGPGDPTISDPLEDGTIDHPFDAIQKALNAIPLESGDPETIWVADGLYRGVGNRNLDFAGKAAILRSVTGPEQCVIDCGGSADNYHRAFVFESGETEQSVVRGFTITGGYFHNGGGIYCDEQSGPAIRDNIIRGNWGNYKGAGIYAEGPALISGNLITDNLIYDNGRGAGIFAEGPARIVDNVITGNSVTGIYCDGGGISCGQGTVISGNHIEGNSLPEYDFCHGAGIYCYFGNVLIIGNTITGNGTGGDGAGIYCRQAGIVISGNTIGENSSGRIGGGIFTDYGNTISSNVILNNTAESGGGIFVGQQATVANNLIRGNQAQNYGGGIWCQEIYLDGLLLTNNTVVENTARVGGGLYCGNDMVHAEAVNCIFWDNSAEEGKEISVGYPGTECILTISYCDVQGGQDSVVVDPGSTINWGPGMLDTDPLFVEGPLGAFYLSQLDAGQSEESPLVNAGSGPAGEVCFLVGDPVSGEPVPECLDQLTTRTDLVLDAGLADMGYHYPPEAGLMPLIVAGPGPGHSNPPLVRVFIPEQGGELLHEFTAYGSAHWGVNVASGRVGGGPDHSILTGPGPGAIYGPHVRGFTVNGTPLPGLSFLAYGTSKYGVNVACGDLDGDGYDEIVTGAGPGRVFGPHVRAFDYDGGPGVSPVPGVSYFAYGTHKYGVNVTAGDIDGDGYDEIVTGAGPGAVFGPHVRGWDVDGAAASPIPSVSFLAYGTNRWGVVVTAGDLDGDGLDEIVTSPGPSAAFAAHVRGWNFDGSAVSEMPGVNFLAWPAGTSRYGARVSAGADLDGDGRCEIVVGQGPDPSAGSELRAYRYGGGECTLWFTLDAFDGGMSHGVNTAGGIF